MVFRLAGSNWEFSREKSFDWWVPRMTNVARSYVKYLKNLFRLFESHWKTKNQRLLIFEINFQAHLARDEFGQYFHKNLNLFAYLLIYTDGRSHLKFDPCPYLPNYPFSHYSLQSVRKFLPTSRDFWPTSAPHFTTKNLTLFIRPRFANFPQAFPNHKLRQMTKLSFLVALIDNISVT